MDRHPGRTDLPIAGGYEKLTSSRGNTRRDGGYDLSIAPTRDHQARTVQRDLSGPLGGPEACPLDCETGIAQIIPARQ